MTERESGSEEPLNERKSEYDGILENRHCRETRMYVAQLYSPYSIQRCVTRRLSAEVPVHTLLYLPGTAPQSLRRHRQQNDAVVQNREKSTSQVSHSVMTQREIDELLFPAHKSVVDPSGFAPRAELNLSIRRTRKINQPSALIRIGARPADAERCNFPSATDTHRSPSRLRSQHESHVVAFSKSSSETEKRFE